MQAVAQAFLKSPTGAPSSRIVVSGAAWAAVYLGTRLALERAPYVETL